MSSPANPLFGSFPSDSLGISAPTVPGIPNLPGNYLFGKQPSSDKGLRKEAARTNILTGRLRNTLAPEFANLMFQYGGDAGKFFSQLLNLGSPFYQRKQQQTFEQGAKAEQDAAGMARQQLAATGQGYTPSGAAAAMFGGMGQAAAGNQEEAFLNNLFQNELLQHQGAEGMAQLASLFNPAALLGANVEQISRGPSAAQNFATVLSSLFPAGGRSIPGLGKVG